MTGERVAAMSCGTKALQILNQCEQWRALSAADHQKSLLNIFLVLGRCLYGERELNNSKVSEESGKADDIENWAPYFGALPVSYPTFPIIVFDHYSRTVNNPDSNDPTHGEFYHNGHHVWLLLQHTTLWYQIPQYHALERRKFDIVFPALNTSPSNFPPEHFNWESWLWAHCTVASRTFPARFALQDDNNLRVGCMIPFLDFANHNPIAKSQWYLDSKTNAVVWEVDETISLSRGVMGDDGDEIVGKRQKTSHTEEIEVFTNYGPKGNFELLKNFGFVIPNNPNDAIEISLSLSRSPSMVGGVVSGENTDQFAFLSPQRRQLLQLLGVSEVGRELPSIQIQTSTEREGDLDQRRFYLRRGVDGTVNGAVPTGLIWMTRLCLVDDQQVDSLLAQAKSVPHQLGQTDAKQVVNSLGFENERAALRLLRSQIELGLSRLQSSTSTPEPDFNNIHNPKLRERVHAFNLYRAGETDVRGAALSHIEQLLLHNFQEATKAEPPPPPFSSPSSSKDAQANALWRQWLDVSNAHNDIPHIEFRFASDSTTHAVALARTSSPTKGAVLQIPGPHVVELSAKWCSTILPRFTRGATRAVQGMDEDLLVHLAIVRVATGLWDTQVDENHDDDDEGDEGDDNEEDKRESKQSSGESVPLEWQKALSQILAHSLDFVPQSSNEGKDEEDEGEAEGDGNDEEASDRDMYSQLFPGLSDARPSLFPATAFTSANFMRVGKLLRTCAVDAQLPPPTSPTSSLSSSSSHPWLFPWVGWFRKYEHAPVECAWISPSYFALKLLTPFHDLQEVCFPSNG